MFHVVFCCPLCNMGDVASLASVAAAAGAALVWTKTLLWQPTGGLLCSSSAGVCLEMQVCYTCICEWCLSAPSLPGPSPEPPEPAARVRVDVSSDPSLGLCPFTPVLCVLSPLSFVSHSELVFPWGELMALCRAWPALGWVFQDGVGSFGRCCLQRGGGCLCTPSVTQLCLTGPAWSWWEPLGWRRDNTSIRLSARQGLWLSWRRIWKVKSLSYIYNLIIPEVRPASQGLLVADAFTCVLLHKGQGHWYFLWVGSKEKSMGEEEIGCVRGWRVLGWNSGHNEEELKTVYYRMGGMGRHSKSHKCAPGWRLGRTGLWLWTVALDMSPHALNLLEISLGKK